jgi:hypothetical protein
MSKAISPLDESMLIELPGGDLIMRGIEELASGDTGEYGLLVLVASMRLRDLGLKLPQRDDIVRPVNLQLYELLEDAYGVGAYSRYNAMLRSLSSFIHALERAVPDPQIKLRSS